MNIKIGAEAAGRRIYGTAFDALWIGKASINGAAATLVVNGVNIGAATNTVVTRADLESYLELTALELAALSEGDNVEWACATAAKLSVIPAQVVSAFAAPTSSVSADVVAAIIGSAVAQNVLLSNVNVTGESLELVEGNEKTLTFDFGSSWNLTGKDLHFVMKLSKEADEVAAVDIAEGTGVTVSDRPNATGSAVVTVPAAGSYFYEFYRANAGLMTGLETIMQGQAVVRRSLSA